MSADQLEQSPGLQALSSLPVDQQHISKIIRSICDHSGDQITINNISEKDFSEIAEIVGLKEGGLPIRYFYDAEISSIIVRSNASPIHESTIPFFQEVTTVSQSHLQGILSSCRVIQGGACKFELYHDNVDSTPWMKAKVPDLSLEVTIDGVKESESPYPTIVAEVGHSQSYENLLGDIEAWLLGSLGHIKCGILVKLEKPASDGNFGDIARWKGFVEVWHRAE